MESVRADPGRELKGHEDRSGTTVHGRAAAAFGGVFVASGVSTGLLVLRDPQLASMNRTAALLASLLFAACGLVFVVHGIAGLRRERRLRAGRSTHPHEPWRWDYPWRDGNVRDDAVRRPLRWLLRAAGLILFLLPFNYLILFGEDFPLPARLGFGVFVALFDVLAIYVLYRLVLSVFGLLRYGGGRLALSRFPVFPGETLDAFLHPGRPIPATTLEATLRCVEERYETRGSGESRSQRVVCYERYRDSRSIRLPAGGTGPSGIHIGFGIPPDAPPTRLGDRPPTYWELHLEAAAPGADYEATFLVPVYARGGTAAP